MQMICRLKLCPNSLLQGWDYQWSWTASSQCKCWHTGRYCTPQQHGCESWCLCVCVFVLVLTVVHSPVQQLSVWMRVVVSVSTDFHCTIFWCLSQFSEEVLKGRRVAFHTVPKVNQDWTVHCHGHCSSYHVCVTHSGWSNQGCHSRWHWHTPRRSGDHFTYPRRRSRWQIRYVYVYVELVCCNRKQICN